MPKYFITYPQHWTAFTDAPWDIRQQRTIPSLNKSDVFRQCLSMNSWHQCHEMLLHQWMTQGKKGLLIQEIHALEKDSRLMCNAPGFWKKHALEEDLGPVCAMAPGFLNIHALEEDLRHRHAPESSRHVTVTNCVALDQQKSLHRVWSWGVTTRQIADEWPHEWKGTGWPHLQNVWSG